MINASYILSSVIQRAISEEDTLSQLFRHCNIHFDVEYNSLYRYAYVQKRVRFMIECCRTMTDIRKWLFTYGHRMASFRIDRNDFKSHSSSSNTNFFHHMFRQDVNIIASTPSTDDEGYRTRMPTMASTDSSFVRAIESSPPSYYTDFDWSSEIDDECF